MDDESLMPFGVHKDKALVNVPADYLLWLYKEKKCFGELKLYIEDNLEALKMEANQSVNKIQKDTEQ